MQPVKRSRVIPFLIAVVLGAAAAVAPPPAAAADNPIVVENLQPGTGDWQIPWGTAADDTTKQIKGYASAVSVNKGGNITFYVSVNTPQTYTIDVYRIGWYQGLGGRLMAHAGPLSGIKQATCPTDATTGLIECRWTPSYTLTAQSSWTSGIYFAILTNAQGYGNYIVFTVRDDNRVADLLYQQPVTTYQAYNNYPNDGLTGKSLLDYKSRGANTVTGSPAAAKVSFDRPYANNGSPDDFMAYEIEFVRWLEQKGYDVTYSTNIDTHTNGEKLLTHRGFLSVGYDAYYTKQMYDNVLAARDAGVNLGFFGANAVNWQARFEPSSTNVPNRVLVSYKNASIDPITDPTLKTVLWRDPLLNRPEQTLIGVQFASTVEWTPVTQWATYVVNNSQNWVYAGTGFKDGDTVTGIVGWRADRFFSQYPGPSATAGTYTLLSRSTFTGDYSNSSVYQAASGAWVFATGSMGWTWALDNYAQTNLVDARIQKTTANVLDRFVAGGTPSSFTIAASPSSQAALLGGSTSYDVTITPSGGFAGNVTLSVGGLPPGASGSFSTNPAATTSTLSVTTPAGTPAGTYTLTITGVNGTLTRTTTVALTVPGITVTAPNTAVSWDVGSTQAVSFTHNLGVGQAVNIDISRDGGASWNLITTVTTASATSGGFSWTVTGPATTQALFRATWVSSTLVTDTSDVNFTIVKLDTTPPSTPIGLAATVISPSQIDLAWNTSTDDVAVAGYKIFRNGTQVNTSSTPSYSDTGLAASTSYSYTVSAFDAANNNSPTSLAVSATTSPSFDFALSSGGNTSVVRGSSVDNSMTATLVSGATQPVTFSTSGLPAGATATYTPASCSPGCATTITIGTTAATPPATSLITVTGTAGSLVRSATFNLTVTAPPSFTIAASPSSQTSPPGGSTSYGVTITPSGGFAGDVTLSVGGLPTGATGAFSTNPAATTSTLSVTTPASTPGGTYTLTITGVSGTLTRTTTVSLVLTVPAITITAPNTAVSWNIGSTQTVSFTHNLGIGQTVNIDISRDGGASWSPITTVTTASATSGGFSWTVTGPATTQARIRATWASSTPVTDTSDVNFTVVFVDTTPPSTPSGLSATAMSPSQINLAWTASTDDVAVAGYKIFRNGTQVGTSSTPSFSDTGLAAATSYTYTVSANDAANNTSAPSAPVSATTLAAFDFALSSGGNTSVARGSSVDNSVTATLVSGATQSVTFSTSGLPVGATATFTPASCAPGCATTITIGTTASTPLATSLITVTGTAGSLVHSATFSLTVTAPPDTTSPAVSLGASPANGSTIGATVALSATASDNVGVVGVQFLLDGANLGAEVTTSPYSISWNTATAAEGPHALSARARDAAGNTAVAAAVNVIVDNQPPTGTIAINGGAAATNSRTSTLTLAATDNPGPVTSMRFSNTGTSFSAEEAYATTKTWTLTAVAGTKTVFVQFKDAIGNWSGSFTDTIVLDTTAPTVSSVTSTNVTGGSAIITWTSSEPTTSQVEYGPTISYGSLTAVDTTLVTAHSTLLTGLNPQTTYNYRVRSVDAAGNERIGANQTFTTLAAPPDATPPSIPTNLAAVAVSATQINLSWNASTDNVAVAGYKVLRNGIQIATVGVPSYASVSLAPSTNYTYTVAAYDALNNTSQPSAAASATTLPDITPPTVLITSPAGGATVSGTIVVTANASDDAGIAGVTFTVDGSTIGTEDTSSPYSVSLNTATLSDGTHTLGAIARNTSNLSTTSAPVSMKVNNTAPPTMMIRYVNTASTVGGDGTTNATTGANRAFKSLLDAINSLPAVLTMPVVIYCDGAGGPDTTPVNQTPFDMVTSAANYLLITTNAANRATVPHDPARYTLMGTNTSVLYNNIPSHIRIDGIQVQLTISNGGTFIGIKTSNANEVATDIDARISNTVVKCVVSNGNAIGFNTRFPSPGAGGSVSVWNSVAYGCTTGFNSDFPGAVYVNNTSYNNNFGYVDDSGNAMKVINSLAAKGTKAGGIGFVGTFAPGSNFNAADDGNRIPGANSSSVRTFTFVNTATADVHLAPTDTGAKDFGTTDPLPGKFGDDIDGDPRSGVWDIGADEVGP